MVSDRDDGNDKGVVDSFVGAFKHELVDKPVLSLAQIADFAFGTEWAKSVEKEGPKPAEFGSADWHAQQIGSAAGTLLPFFLVHKGVSAKFGSPAMQVALDAERLSSAERMVLGMTRVKTAALSGAIYSGLFQPVTGDAAHGSWHEFLGQKFTHAGVTALTFGGLTAGSVGLNEMGVRMASAGKAGFFSNMLRNDIASTALAGVPVGAGNAQLNSLVEGRGFASARETAESAYTFGMVGGVLGLAQKPLNRTFESYRNAPSEKAPEGMPAGLAVQPEAQVQPWRLPQDGAAQQRPYGGQFERPGEVRPMGRPGATEVQPGVEVKLPELQPLNVGSKHGEPVAQDMSNFAHTPFTIDGKTFQSVEGFYVYLKWSAVDPVKAEQAVDLVGYQAKKFGKSSKATEGTYNGQTFELGSPEHHALIKRAIQAKLEQNPELARRFMETYPRPIEHDLGYPEPATTKLPAKDFSRILTELRQDLVDGKIKLEQRMTPDGQPMPPSRKLTDVLTELESTPIAQRHPIARYKEAFRDFDREVTSVLKSGGDSIVVQLNDGSIMHITNKLMTPDLGTRPFDLPIIEQGTRPSVGGRDIHYFIQPRATTPVTEAAVRDFQQRIGQDGWSMSDPGPRQLGTWNGQTYLLDPFAVQRTPKYDRR